MWQEPSLLLLHPTISAAMRRFRAHGLPQAMINGAAEGLTGAIWPWESEFSNAPSPRCRLTRIVAVVRHWPGLRARAERARRPRLVSRTI